jgi:hypothetical protein
MGKQKKFFIQEHLQKTVFHGGVGNIDIERILLENGFQAIEFPFHYNFHFKAKALRYLYLLKIFFSLSPDAIIFFQFPLYARMHKLLLRALRLRPSIRVICIIVDVNGLKDGNAEVIKKEIGMLSQFRYFIVHGKPMENWLKANVPRAITSCLNFFDFLTPPAVVSRKKSAIVAFAGNLAKSPFIEKLHLVTSANSELTFHIYGPDASRKMINQPQVILKGIYPPYELPSVLEASFGLLWDGESIEGAGGSLGDYMQYISHHKLSLYILAGLPIIAYENAGSAEMIKKMKIGLTAKTIMEIGQKIKHLSEEDYQLMRSNMKPIASRISKGENLLAAIAGIFEQMKGQK